MTHHQDLTLYEAIMLLSLRDREGTTISGSWYQHAVAGAIMAELMMKGCIKLRENGKKRFVLAGSTKMAGDKLLDECLQSVTHTPIPKSMKDWIGKWANIKELKHRVAGQLCQRRILRSNTDKVMLFFTRRIYPEIDPKPERALIGAMERAIFGPRVKVDARIAVLISLSHHTGLLTPIFGKHRLTQKKDRIRAIADGELVGKVTKELIDAIEVAMMMTTVIVPITT